MVWSKSKPSMVVLSSPLDVDLVLYKGDTGTFRITMTDEDGDPIDIHLATWDADIRVNKADANPVVSFTVATVGGDNSSVDVTISAVNSASLALDTYFYDVQMTLSGNVSTVLAGLLHVTQDVSR